MLEKDDFYLFADETPQKEWVSEGSWKVLIVDDDEGIHDITVLAFQDFCFENKSVSFLHAYSAQEAKTMMQAHPDIALILLDVVMESEDSGLRFIHYIREELKNNLVRIILRTGQPGSAPEKRIIIDYDINDYKEKTDLTNDKLFTAFVIALRSFRDLRHIESNKLELQKIIEAEARFVPRDFLKLLNKPSIADIKLGDCLEQDITILFLDMRSFSTLLEHLTPVASFQFINSCLSYIEPAIVNNKGFIDKYIGDAIMALFCTEPEHALKSSIDILKALDHYNHDRAMLGQVPVQVGIGINTGASALGTIGFHDRMDCTVIGDAVNIAARLEEITKQFNAGVLFSEFTFNKLTQPELFNIRCLGRVMVKGKRELVKIYEAFDADADTIKQLKSATKIVFEQGVDYYSKQQLKEALHCFQEVLASNPSDSAAKYYLNKIEIEQLL